MGKIIGLTGGIASGKSTVTSYLREKGYAVIDADRVVHDLQAQGGELYQALVEHFGTEIFLDRLVQPGTRRNDSQSFSARTGSTGSIRRDFFHGYPLVD